MYLLEVGIGATRFGIRRTFFSKGFGGTVETTAEFEIEGEWTCLAETWSEEKSFDTLFATSFLVRAWCVILGNLLLNLSTTFTDSVTSFRHM